MGRDRFYNDLELELVGVVTDRLQPIITDIGNIPVVGHASIIYKQVFASLNSNAYHGVLCLSCHSLHMQDVKYVLHMTAFNDLQNVIILLRANAPEVLMAVRVEMSICLTHRRQNM